MTSKSHLVCNHDHFHAKNERIRFSGQNLENGHQAQITVIIQAVPLCMRQMSKLNFKKISKKFQKIQVTSKSHSVCNHDRFDTKNEQIRVLGQNWENWNSVQNHIEIQGSTLVWCRMAKCEFHEKIKKIEVTSKSHLVCNTDPFHAKNEQIWFSVQNWENWNSV